MRNPSRPLTSSVVQFALIAALLSSCGYGSTVGTQNLRPAGSGVHTSVADILIQSVVLVRAEDGTLSLSGTVLSKAELVDSLIAVLIDGQTASLFPAEQVLTPGQPVRFGYRANNFADLQQNSLQAGQTVSVSFNFASGAKVEVKALIVENSNPMYSEVTPAPVLCSGQSSC